MAGALITAISVLAVVSSLVVGVQVFRVGETGARAVWGGVVSSTSAK